LVKFWRILQWKMMVYFMGTWSISPSFVIFYGHLESCVVIWYIFSRFGILYQDKSGNPAFFLPTIVRSPSRCTHEREPKPSYVGKKLMSCR
jgi:hypothetical protein